MVNAMSREFVLKQILNRVKDRYDANLIDCMPSLGMITVNALAASDEVLIPVEASYLPIKGLQQRLKKIGKVRRQINPKLQIALDNLHPFSNHPFKVLDDDKMAELSESVRKHGVLVPGIVRIKDTGGYEIIAGHRRKRACEIAGLKSEICIG